MLLELLNLLLKPSRLLGCFRFNLFSFFGGGLFGFRVRRVRVYSVLIIFGRRRSFWAIWSMIRFFLPATRNGASFSYLRIFTRPTLFFVSSRSQPLVKTLTTPLTRVCSAALLKALSFNVINSVGVKPPAI